MFSVGNPLNDLTKDPVIPTLTTSRPARRGVAAALAMATLVLAACGSDDSSSPSTEPVASTTSAAGAATTEPGAYPVTIEHRYGSTTITDAPERVVTLGLNDQDYVLAFGVQPVAAVYWNGDEGDVTQVWTDAVVASEPAVLQMDDGINIEAVAAARPDLIIAMFADVNDATYTALSALAPTVVRGAEHADFGVPWQETTLVVGRALGQPAHAAQLVADLEGRFAATAAAHPEWSGATFALLDFNESMIGIYRSDEPRPRFFENLGLTVPAAVDALAGAETWGQVSLEQADAFDTDVLIWRVGDTAGKEPILGEPVLAALPAMRDDRVVWLDLSSDVGYAFGWGTVLSLPFALDGLVPALEAAIPAP